METNDFCTGFARLLFQQFEKMSNPRPFAEKAGVVASVRASLKAAGLKRARKANLFWLPKSERAFAEVRFIFGHNAEFQSLRASLADDESKEALLETLVLRVLGPYYVRPRFANDDYWARLKNLHPARIAKKDTVNLPGFPKCNYYEFPWNSGTIKCHASPFGIMTIFVAEQYAYRRPEVEVAAKPGDVVLDAGGYLGETGLYFAEKVAPSGRVFVFEFNDAARGIMSENIRLNPTLASVIETVPLALWRESGKVLTYQDQGPGTTLARQKGNTDHFTKKAQTVSIDDFVAQKGLDKIDFLKLDVEGAELGVLRGAEKTLKKCRPRLAISVYHSINDFLQIPEFLQSLRLNYRYYLRHASTDETETVLFAMT